MKDNFQRLLHYCYEEETFFKDLRKYTRPLKDACTVLTGSKDCEEITTEWSDGNTYPGSIKVRRN